MGKLIVSSSPHIHERTTTQSIMRDVLIALLPATAASVVFFGIRALINVLVCVIAAVVSEFLFNLICKREQTVSGSAFATAGTESTATINAVTHSTAQPVRMSFCLCILLILSIYHPSATIYMRVRDG